MDESTVFQIVETHGGGYSILYKTYEQSVRARDIRDSVENANGTAVLPIAKAKLGSEYCQGKMEGGKCHGEVQKFTLGKLPRPLHYHERNHEEARFGQGQGSGSC